MPSRRALAITFGLLLTVYSLSWMYLVRQESEVLVGIDAQFRPICECLELRAVTPQSPAQQAGLQVGDTIRAVDGRPFDRYEPFLDLRRYGKPGQRVTFSVERGGATRDVTLEFISRRDLRGPSSSAQWSNPGALMRLVQEVLALYPIPFLVVTLVVLLQRPDDPNAWLLALMLGGFIAGAGIGEFEYRVPPVLRGPILAFSLLLGAPLAGLTYAFFSGFPARAPIDVRLPWLKVFALAAGYAVAGALAVGTLITGGSYFLFWIDERLDALATPIGYALLLYSGGFFLLAIVALVQNAFGPLDVRRKTRVILFGLLVGCIPISVIQIIVGVTGTRPQDLPAGLWVTSVLLLFAIPLSLGYTVVKHRAMEIPVLLRRSARYLLVRRGLVTVAVLIGVVVTLGFARVFDRLPIVGSMDRTQGGLLLGSIFGGLMVLVGRKVWTPAFERLDRAFFRGAYDARHLLMTLAEQTRTATDTTTLAEMIDHAVVQALHPTTLLVFLRGGDDWTFEAAAHEGLSGEAARLPITPTQLVEIARRGRPVLIDPAQLAPGGAWASMAALRPEAIVPLIGRSRQIEGLLVLGARLSEEPYSGEDVSLLASVGTQSGLALENIRLAESMAARMEAERRVARELEIAREVQAKLLPQDRPVLASLDYAGACLQARIVGGDYFDFVSLSPDQFGLVLADISGKGISAALLMASLQANLRAQYANAPNDLARVLASVNKIFFDSTASNHYATLFFGVYDESQRRLTYANCGHLPPIVLRADGTVVRLGVTAPVVGLFEAPWHCTTGETCLLPGDTLVVFTDGVSEATSDDGDEFGEERLIELVRRRSGLPAPALLDAIVTAVREHSSEEQFDDLTLIVAHVR